MKHSPAPLVVSIKRYYPITTKCRLTYFLPVCWTRTRTIECAHRNGRLSPRPHTGLTGFRLCTSRGAYLPPLSRAYAVWSTHVSPIRVRRAHDPGPGRLFDRSVVRRTNSPLSPNHHRRAPYPGNVLRACLGRRRLGSGVRFETRRVVDTWKGKKRVTGPGESMEMVVVVVVPPLPTARPLPLFDRRRRQTESVPASHPAGRSVRRRTDRPLRGGPGAADRRRARPVHDERAVYVGFSSVV